MGTERLNGLVLFLWEFVWVRYAVVMIVLHGPQWLGEWLAKHTPLLDGLRELFLSSGDLDQAARCSREIRRLTSS